MSLSIQTAVQVQKKLCQTSSESIKTPIRLKTLLQQVEKCSA